MNTALKLIKDVSGKRDYRNRNAMLEPKRDVLFRDFITITVDKRKKRMAKNYPKNYQTLIKRLDEFSYRMQSDIYTDSINEDFIDDFILYLEGEDLRMNYINGLLALVKSMVSKAGKAGYAVDPSFDIVEYDHEESFSIALSIIEIARIYYFIGLTRFQERIRDFFILSCLTALRFSDYSTLTEENFGKENLTKMTQKTKKKVVIPLHQIVKDIHAKYDGDITLNKSSQYFNRAIKQICKKVGLDDPITYSYTKGGKYITETKPKWQLVKSHTGRRSMATNLKLTGRISTHEIMSLLGHSNESTTNKYLKITKEDDARSIGGDSYFRI